jgi:uncharacterized membrane protein YhaH (DUF805 family)
MDGLVRLAYWLGWVFLALAVIGRILLLTSVSEHMIAANILPRNFIQLSFLFFLISIATTVCHRQKP